MILDEPANLDILKKNVSTSEFTTLQRIAKTWTEEARAKNEMQQNIAANDNLEVEEVTIDAIKATNEATVAMDATVEAKGELLTVKNVF